jgi:hypothetical protein
MFIPLKMVLIGIDPYPNGMSQLTSNSHPTTSVLVSNRPKEAFWTAWDGMGVWTYVDMFIHAELSWVNLG